MITEINGQSIRQLRPEIQAALDELTKATGVAFSIGNGTYARDGLSGSLKLEFTVAGENGEVESKSALDFKRMFAHRNAQNSLTASDLGATFQTADGAQLKIVGANPNARRSDLLVECVKRGARGAVTPGKTYKMGSYEAWNYMRGPLSNLAGK